MSVVANVAINVDSRNAVTKLRQVQSQSQATERAVNGLGAAVGKLAAAFSAIQAARFVFVQTAELEKQTRSLEVLTGSATKAAQIIKELKDIGAVTPFTSTELIDSAKRLQAFGVETNKVVETTRRLADVSGATGAELQGLVTAYGQVQAKGRLQGEELLQFQERGVALQQVLREEYKLSGEEFQDALSKGRISAEAVEFAIQKLTDAGGKYANGAIAQSDTLAGRLSTLQDAVQNLAQRLGTILAPAMQSILGLAIDIANQINSVFETILLQRQLGANLAPAMRDKLFKQAGQEALGITESRYGLDIFGRPKNQADFTKLREERFRDLMRTYGYQQGILTPPTAAPPSAAATLPGLTAGTTGGGGRGRSGTDKAAREAERLAREIERSLAAGRELGTQFQRQIQLMDAATEIEKQRLQIQFDFEDRAKQIAELKDAEQRTSLDQLNAEIQRLELIDLQTEALKRQAQILSEPTVISNAQEELSFLAAKIQGKEEEYRLTQAINDLIARGADPAVAQGIALTLRDLNAQNKAIESQKQLWADIYTTVAGQLQQAISGLIDGTAEWGDLLSNILGSLGNLFVSAGFNALGGALQLPGFRANGGPVSSNTPYIVGERGPELFVPSSSGSVMSNADTRAALAEQSAARSNNDTRAMLNQQTAARQANATGMALQQQPIDVRYESTVINQTEYVTAEQHRKGLAQAAERGRALTLAALQNSTRTRKKVGI